MCERALSRRTKGELLADKQMTQEKIADAYTMMMQYRLHVLYTAWLIDKHKEYNREVRKEIAAIKARHQRCWSRSSRAPCICTAVWAALTRRHWRTCGRTSRSWGGRRADRSHKIAVAKAVLRHYSAHDALFPSYHTPTLNATKALEKYGHFLAGARSAIYTRWPKERGVSNVIIVPTNKNGGCS